METEKGEVPKHFGSLFGPKVTDPKPISAEGDIGLSGFLSSDRKSA